MKRERKKERGKKENKREGNKVFGVFSLLTLCGITGSSKLKLV